MNAIGFTVASSWNVCWNKKADVWFGWGLIALLIQLQKNKFLPSRSSTLAHILTDNAKWFSFLFSSHKFRVSEFFTKSRLDFFYRLLVFNSHINMFSLMVNFCADSVSECLTNGQYFGISLLVLGWKWRFSIIFDLKNNCWLLEEEHSSLMISRRKYWELK